MTLSQEIRKSSQLRFQSAYRLSEFPWITDTGCDHSKLVVNSPLALIKAGRIKPLFVTSAQRSPVLPDVQTLAEGGSSPIDAAGWQGVMAPAQTPPAIVKRLGAEIAKAMVSPEMKSALAAQGAYSIASTPERYASFFADEMERFKKTVDALGLKLD